jgi:thiamine-phosphate pyrophosphorylase
MLRYVITDRTLFPGDEAARQAALIAQATRLAVAGVDFIQLREKDLSAASLADLAHRLLAVLRAHSPAPRLLINSRVDVAIATGADGVHLTSSRDALTPVQVRSLYAAAGLPEPLVSISCHTLDDVAHARAAAATHILFGPVFEKVVADKRVTAGTGLDLLRSASAAAAPIPVLALGGITPANAQDCLASGAAGIAAIRLFSSDSAAILPNSAIDLDRATPYA